MTEISFAEILQAIEKIKFGHYDLVVGIAEGGVVAAALVASKIGCDLKIIRFNYRNRKNIPRYREPLLLNKAKPAANTRSILLVDDVSVSGKTLTAAKKLFRDCKVTTLVIKGKADYVLFPHLTTCVRWPWQLKH